MAVQLKAPDTINLLEAIKQLTGESTEIAVKKALQERLDRLREPEDEEERWARVQELVDSLAKRFRESKVPYVDHGELLYGEDGLPR